MGEKEINCRICGNGHGNTIHSFEERMFNTGELFRYLECRGCNCLQLLDIPEDISKYYPSGYSNFSAVKYKKQSRLSAYLKARKSEFLLKHNRNLPGFLLSLFTEPGFVKKLEPAGLKFNNRILDLGAGNGDRLLRLSYRDFNNLMGTDPFISEDINFENGLTIYKKELDELNEKFDFVMLNHSFEHMPNPLEILLKLNKLISVGQFVLIRIPVADSYAYKHYRHNWIALDPPRHFFLHTRKSMEVLAEKSGFSIKKAIDDSTEYQFIGSEQLVRGIKSRDKNSYYVNPELSVFSKSQIYQYKRKARKLNARNEGDATCFYLIKTKDVDEVNPN